MSNGCDTRRHVTTYFAELGCFHLQRGTFGPCHLEMSCCVMEGECWIQDDESEVVFIKSQVPPALVARQSGQLRPASGLEPGERSFARQESA